ncbi:hypothetical protein WCLE_004360 [Wolbachia endosymbiont of Cimex lectularius]|nr:hypothetical protein WCLE_004360 [Wolbachia endosymbiont of Cimex lectularius]
MNVICEKFSEKAPPLQKIVAFRSSNVLWGANTNIQLKFYAWKSGDNIPLAVSVIRNFGSKSLAAPQVIQVAEYTIDSDDPKVYFSRFALPKVTIPKDIGDDQYLLLQFSLPKNQKFDLRATNFYCAEVSSPVSVVDFKYPVQNSDLAKSHLLFSSFSPTKYGIDDGYKELIFTIEGLKFADNVGEIVTYPKGAKVNEKEINLMKCDGRALDANGMSPLGIEYRRLYEKLGLTPVTFDMLKTKDTPNWFNAISSKYIKKFVADNKVKVAFDGKGVVSSKPEGDGIADLWIETTFHANPSVDYNFQYVVSNSSDNMEIITCCHSFDITTNYLSEKIRMTSNGLFSVKFADSDSDFSGYFRTTTKLNHNNKGIDEVTKKTEISYSVKDGFFYLTVSLNYQQFPYPSGLCGFFNPVNFTSRVYDIGFPLIIPKASATFLQPTTTNCNCSQNYFLFSPWFVCSMYSVYGTDLESASASTAYATVIMSYDKEIDRRYPLIKSWGNHVIYKQSPTDKRIPGKPNVLFTDKNSVITYAMQHKALFTQRCLYAIKLNKKGSWEPIDWIGFKRYDNTDPGYVCDLVIWWNTLGDDDTPYRDIAAKEYVKINTDGMKTEDLADAIVNIINTKGTTMFNIPNITDSEKEYYIRY